MVSAKNAVLEYCVIKKIPIGINISPTRFITIVKSYALHSVLKKKLNA